MNILGVLLFIGLMVFTIHQTRLLVISVKEKKKAQQNKDVLPDKQVADVKTKPNKEKGV